MKKIIILVCLGAFSQLIALHASVLLGEFNASTYQLCFTPGASCTSLIDKTIAQAKTSILVQAYSFTSKPIIKSLLKAQQRGVALDILLDKSNVGRRYAVIVALDAHHVPYLIDYQPEIAHNKVMIIDDHTVITGSFNFTKAAEYYYAENVLVVHDQVLAHAYTKNFYKRKAASESLYRYCHPVNVDNATDCHSEGVLLNRIHPDKPWGDLIAHIHKRWHHHRVW